MWKCYLLSCVQLCNFMECSPPGSSAHGIFQTILEWVAMRFSRQSSQPRDWTRVSCMAGKFFTIWATRESPKGCNTASNYSLFFLLFFFNLLYWFWHTLTKNKGLFWKTKTLCRRDCIVGLSWFFFFFFDPTRLLKEMYVLCQDFIHCHPLD